MNITISHNGNTSSYYIENNKQLVIGRSNGDIVIPHPAISSKHATLGNDNGKLWIEDHGSTNGTYINQRKLEPHSRRYIQDKDTIHLLPSKAIVIALSSKEEIDTLPPNGNNLSDLLQKKQRIVIGRSKESDIILNDLSVSRKHAQVYLHQNGVWVEDLNSINGTYINNKRISQPTLLGEKDILYIGLHSFSLHNKPQNLEKGNALVAKQISKVFKNGNVGFHTTDIEIPFRQMVALMGPSGCGKSTLLRALNGDEPPTKGTITMFGLDLHDHYEHLKQMISYVPQEHIVHNDLTVEDSLYYAAKLRLPKQVEEEEIQQRIEDVLRALNIHDAEIKRTKVGNLSGGQKKRVSIAVELITKPKILFLDEPTSPLDPETVEDFLKCIQKLCKEGTTVVMVTHKPEDLAYMDKIIFMGAKGYLTYDGDKDSMLSYFEKKNIIEVYSLLSTEKQSKLWYDRRNHKHSENFSEKKFYHNPETPDIFHQTYWLTKRYFDIKISNTNNLILIVLQPIIIAFLIVAVFSKITDPLGNGNLGILFLMAVSAIWFGVSNSAKEIVGEKAIFKRERMYNLQIGPYILSKILVLTAISTIQIFIFCLLLFIKYDLNQFVFTWAFLSLVSLVAVQFGLLLSANTRSTEEVMSILPIALIPQIILAGIIHPIQNDISLFLSYFTIGRWGTEGLGRIQDLGLEIGKFLPLIDLQLYSISDSSITNSLDFNIAALVILFAVMFLMVYSFLINYHQSK